MWGLLERGGSEKMVGLSQRNYVSGDTPIYGGQINGGGGVKYCNFGGQVGVDPLDPVFVAKVAKINFRNIFTEILPLRHVFS